MQDLGGQRIGTRGKEICSISNLTATITGVAAKCGKAVPRFERKLPASDLDVMEVKGLENLRRNINCAIEKAKITFKII